MKNGIANPTIETISKIFKANNIPCELVLTIKVDGKKDKKRISL